MEIQVKQVKRRIIHEIEEEQLRGMQLYERHQRNRCIKKGTRGMNKKGVEEEGRRGT